MTEETSKGVLKRHMALSILWGIVTIPAAIFFATALLTYDSTSVNSIRDTIVLWGSLTFPIVTLIAFAGGVYASRGVRTPRKNRMATTLTLIPLINIAAVLLLLI